MGSRRIFTLCTLAAVLAAAGVARAGTATDVNGLYYTGVNDTYGLLNGAATDSHWTVAFANIGNTNYTGNSTYSGSSYVVSGQYVDAGWAPNTSSAQWITAPGARTSSGGTANAGGVYLPGNGIQGGTGDGRYIYRLAFTITGTGSTSVANQVSISLTIAADDRYSVYLNPSFNATTGVITGTAAATRTDSWNNTQTAYLQNFTNTNSGANSNFVIGTNYIYIVVDNTNSITTTSSATALNPSGLLVYQVGSAITIDGKPVPEVGTILPVLGAFGLLVARRWRRREKPTAPAGS